MLSNASRLLTYLNAVLYTILGALLFLLPEQLAPVFAWKVTAFMTLTIGGWCLGNAWLAYFIAKRWDWQRVYTTLIYFWLFGVMESIIVYLFRAKLALVHPIAWLYLITLVVNVIAAILGIFELLRNRPARAANVSQTTVLQRVLALGFVVFVGFLGYYGLTAQIGDPGTNGGIFPEVMSLFTLRSFGAFYFSLSLAAIPLI
jgi:energy-converting hydrogenase Eha subunit A